MKILKNIFCAVCLAALFAGGLFARSAAEYVRAGNNHYKSKDYTSAIIAWHKAVAEDLTLQSRLAPHLANAYAKRGAEYYLKKDYDRALVDFDEALRLNPGLEDVRKARELARQPAAARPPPAQSLPEAKPASAEKTQPVTQTPPAARPQKVQPPAGKPSPGSGDFNLVSGLLVLLSILLILTPLGILIYWLLSKAWGPLVRWFRDSLKPPVLPPAGPAAAEEGVSGLMRDGEYTMARDVLARKRRLEFDDFVALLRIHINLADFMRAKLALNQISQEIQTRPGLQPDYRVFLSLAEDCANKGETDLAHQLRQLALAVMFKVRPAREFAETYYSLALSFESAGETDLAVRLYTQLMETGRPYRDVEARLAKLKEKPAPKAVTPQKAAAPQSALRTGVNIRGLTLGGRYELRDVLGEGGMGVVYEAWDGQLNRKVAVKRMHSWLRQHAEAYTGFRREAQIVAKLRHPNIIGVQGIIEEGNDVFVVFDHVDGKSLSDIIEERRTLPLKECKAIMKGVCEAVDYAHRSKVIHRDLKPSNIMLDGNGYPYVMDFGLASELRDDMTRLSRLTSSGTSAYMAPEQHQGTVKKESDIYALGVCLYEMLSGELPFEGDHEKKKKLKIYKELSARVPWLPGGVDKVIDRALEPEPSQRYAGALEFYAALDKV